MVQGGIFGRWVPILLLLLLALAVQESIERNPNLPSVRFAAESAERGILPAGSLPDPTLSLACSNLPVNDFSLDKELMNSRDIGFTRALPGAGVSAIRQAATSRKEAVDRFREPGPGVPAVVWPSGGSWSSWP